MTIDAIASNWAAKAFVGPGLTEDLFKNSILGAIEEALALDISDKERLEAVAKVRSERNAGHVVHLKKFIEDFVYQRNIEPGETMQDFIVRRMGYCYVTMANAFKQQEGMTLSNYFQKVRVDRIKEIIQYNPKVKHYVIAEMIDVSCASFVAVIFKRATGMTIDEYKRSLKEKPVEEPAA